MDDNLLTIGQTAKILGVSIDTLRRWDKAGKFSSVRIGASGHRYYRKSDIKVFIKDPFALARKWASSVSAYEPEKQFYCKTRDVFQARLEHFQSELMARTSEAFSSLITAIAGEIGNNSFDHNLGNWPDIVGVYFSYSLAQKRIILADRGLGVLSTLKRVKPDLSSNQEALEVAFTQTISGRAAESRGNGLKFVRDVVENNPISLFFQTGDAYLEIRKDKNYYKITTEDASIPGCLAVIEY